MANANATPALPALGQVVLLTENINGFAFERRGRVIGHVVALPGSRCSSEFLLDQENGDCVFYSPHEVTIHHVE